MTLITPEYLRTQRYSAMRDRLALEHGGAVQPGVWGVSDYKVIQRASGANMSVDVGTGFALVDANSSSNLGVYHVQNDAPMNVSIAAADGAQPRLDQIYLVVNDSEDAGDTSDLPQFLAVAGTPAVGVTLDNRAGAAAAPENALLLADVLVPAASASVVTANIRDRRPWARGAFRSIVRNSNAGATDDYTTASTTLANVDSTNLLPRLELTGVPVEITLRAQVSHSIASGQYAVAPAVNAVLPNGANPGPFTRDGSGTAARANYVEQSWIVVPTAGSALVGPQFAAITAGTVSLLARVAAPLQFIVRELVTQNGDNS